MSESDLNLIKNDIAPAMGFYIDFDNSIDDNWKHKYSRKKAMNQTMN